MLQCGHCLCVDCLATLIKRLGGRRHFSAAIEMSSLQRHTYISCPLCRERASTEDVHYVRSETNDIDDEDVNLIVRHNNATLISYMYCMI